VTQDQVLNSFDLNWGQNQAINQGVLSHEARFLDDAAELIDDTPAFTFEGQAADRVGEFPPGPSVDIKGFGDRLRTIDNAGSPVEPLNYTKSGYIQRPGETRVHRRGWNAQQVEEARKRAIQAIKQL
jgi:hypothetical protein